MTSLHARQIAVKEIVDWAMAQDFADELDCHLSLEINRRMDKTAKDKLAADINLLIEKAVNEVIHE